MGRTMTDPRLTPGDPLAPARGCLLGLALSLVLWALILWVVL